MPIYTCPHCQKESDAREMQRRASPRPRWKPCSTKPVRTGRYRLWQCMRQQRRFTHRDLAATAEVHHNTAAFYVNQLVRAGYVRVVAAQIGIAGSYKQFVLIRDTGPRAPRWQSDTRSLFDDNLGREMPNV